MCWLLNNFFIFYKKNYYINFINCKNINEINFNKNLKNFYYFFENFFNKIYRIGKTTKITVTLNKKNYFFSKINKQLFLLYFNTINLILSKGFNVFFIDWDYKYFLPIYNILFSFNEISKNKSFFFIKRNDIILSNWFYKLKIFLNHFNFNFLMFSDSNFFSNFFEKFKKLGFPVFSILHYNHKQPLPDFYFYAFKSNLFKLYFYNIIFFIFFKNFNLKKLFNKNYFLSKFKK